MKQFGFTSVFTIPCQATLCWARQIQSIYLHPTH